MSKQKGKNKQEKINIFVFLRDVLLEGLSRGKLLPITISLIVIVAIVRMPSEDVSKLVFDIYTDLVGKKIIGYVLFSVSLICWGMHLRWQRRVNAREVHRLSKERNEWQKKAIGDCHVETSKRRIK